MPSREATTSSKSKLVLSHNAKGQVMKETQTRTWTSITHLLETAVLLPQQHDEMISRALQHMLTSLPAVGTALICPCPTRKVPWKVYYVGSKSQGTHRWLTSRLHPSLDTTTGVLQHDLTHHLCDMSPHILIPLNPRPSSPGGLWILWADPSSLLQAVLKSACPIQQTFEAMLEVEDREAEYFSASSPLYDRELIEVLSRDDPHALSALLSLTRLVAQADFTFWARAYDHAIEVTSQDRKS